MLRPVIITVLLTLAAVSTARGEAFTYQGELRQSGEPFDGTADLTFRLYAAASGGTQIGTDLFADDMQIDQGRFTIDLDFGAGVFDGSPRWLEIAVTLNDATTILAPRQPIMPAPYAIYAMTAPDSGGDDGWQVTGQTVAFGGNVGIGMPGTAGVRLAVNGQSDPIAMLLTSASTFGTTSSLANITSDAHWQTIVTGVFNPVGPGSLLFHDAEAGATRLTIDPSGNVGIGTTDPNHPLNFANTLGQKIALWGNGATNYGLGIQAGLLQIHTAVNSADVAFGFGGSSNFTETMRIKGTGNVGIGTIAPATSLDIRRPVVDGKGQLVLVDPVNPATSIAAMAGVSGFGNDIGSAATGRLWYLGSLASTNRDASLLNSTTNGRLTFGTAGRTDDMVIDSTGRVGIGTPFPLGRFNVVGSNGPTTARFDNADVNGTLLRIVNTSAGGREWGLRSSGSGNPEGAGRFVVADLSASGSQARFSVRSAIGTSAGAGEAVIHGSDGGPIIILGPATGTPNQGRILVLNDSGAAASSLSVNADGTGSMFSDHIGCDDMTSGEVSTGVLRILGGSDIAEPFNVTAAQDAPIEPGMVVSIDPTRMGELRLSSSAYDRTVAGILSGAGGIRPGMTLSQKDTIADGAHPVALTGRVWCRVDAGAGGAIQPGDLLTTSDTPGHAMKVSDHARAHGATIGKAMSGLESGRGLVLVLVSLQ